MRYKYFVTSGFESKYLDRKNLGNDVLRRLNEFLESDEPLKASSVMANLLVSKINVRSGLRFIWFQIIRRDVCMYVLRRIYRHDEYTKKLNEGNKQIWMDRHPITQEELTEIDQEFAKFFKESKRDFLPEEYRKYEDSRAFDKYRDVIYYEMPLWGEGMKKVPQDYWMSVQQALPEQIITDYEQYDKFCMHHLASGYTITYRFGEPNIEGKSDIYLLQITRGKEANLEELLDRKYDCEDVCNLQNYSSKCYPDYYTYDYPTWKDIEEDELANLALSEEEVKVLQNVKLPFFVSGLAGSGKSTILYYLYANIYKYLSLKHPDHKLLFLSYNDDLVNKARMSVRSILCYHSTNEGFKSYFDDEQNVQHFENSFASFRDFLKNAFLDEDGIKRFSEGKHITYEKFRELYKSEYKQSRKPLSPSILWSVIRTFIKGRSLHFFTPDDYISDSINRNDRIVDTDVYTEAYRIWDNWYRHYNEENRGWDDLDLVRYALTNGDYQNVFHKYAVIFCDEAQDFTKLEIDLILSLSKHSEYMLSSHPDDKRIPIAFAGDPNQTISPTGFRWAGTKAIFNKSFEECLDSYPELDDPELSKNYRSQLGIVKFANTIQSIRYKYFDETSRDRKLQSVREDPKGDNPDALEYVGFYSFDKHKDVILNNLQNANIITAGDGYEGDRSCFPEIKDDKVKLYTALGTKGNEYKAVMLLNFSTDPSYKSFQKIVNDESFTDDSERFEAAHFFTKLYIAISRAKEQLFIVDTEEGYENFWKYFTDSELWKSLINRFVQDADKRKLVGHVTQGDILTLPQRLSETYDPEENARQEFERARTKGEESIERMKRAQSYFLEAGLTARADECDAYIFLYSFDFNKAGDKFLSLGQKENALNAFWKGNNWEKMITLLSNSSSLNAFDEIRLLVAKFMVNDMQSSLFLQELVNRIDKFQDAIVSHREDQSIWTNIFNKFSADLKSIDGVEISISLMKNLDFLARFIQWYDKGLAGLRAYLYFTRAEFMNKGLTKDNTAFSPIDYLNAIKLWDVAGINNTSDYYKAHKITAKNQSEEILWMEELREYDEIVSKYGEQNEAKSLTDVAGGIVFNCLLSRNYEKAVSYPFPKDQQTKWQRLYAQSRPHFLTYVVLNAFSQDKYYFLSDKIQQLGEPSVFDDRLPKFVYDQIFNLKGRDDNNMPYWTYFTSLLKDVKGERVFMRSPNLNEMLESLSGIIMNKSIFENDDKALISCFIEILFTRDYNDRRADKFNSVLVKIFSNDIFCRDDFRIATDMRNEYFTIINNLDGDQLNAIGNNIRHYANYYLEGIKKTIPINDIIAITRMLEICAPFSGMNPDFAYISNTYNKLLRRNVTIEVKTWLKERQLFNQFMDDCLMHRASYRRLVSEFNKSSLELVKLTDRFSKEDAAMFVASANAYEDANVFEATFLISQLIYRHHLRRDNLKMYCIVNNLVAKLPPLIDDAIENVIAQKGRVNEYAIKVLTYTWEALYDHTFVADKYDDVIKKQRLARVRYLSEYLKKRALLHYSYLKGRIFEKKQDEYGIMMTRDYLPAAYPRIEDKKVAKIPSVQSKDNEHKEDNTSLKADPKKDNKAGEKKKNISSKDTYFPTFKTDASTNAAKMAQLDMARNLKKMGVDVNIIRKSAPQLTLEEIERL